MAFNGLKVIHSRLDNRIAYILNPEKTNNGLYTGGVNTTPPFACRDMQQTKARYGKTDGRLGYHVIQSFMPGEITPLEAMRVGKELIHRYLHGHYEVVYAVHTDHEHIHLHIIWNSVSFIDGNKFHAPPGTYLDEIRRQSDKICKERGYSVIQPNEKRNGQHYAAWKAEQTGQTTLRDSIRADMDAAIRASVTWTGFLREMQAMGYRFKTDCKHVAIQAPGHPRYVRLKSLGEKYMPEAIQARILRQQRRERLPQAKPPRKRSVVFQGSFTLYKPTWEAIRALYSYYLNLLRKMEKQATGHHMAKDAYLKIHQDRLRFTVLQERFQFLSAHRLDTTEQIQAYAKQVQEKITPLLQQREQLYAQHRRVKTPEEATAASKAIGELNAILKTYRKEEGMCRVILREAPSLERVVRKVRQPIQREEKAKEKPVYRGR